MLSLDLFLLFLSFDLLFFSLTILLENTLNPLLKSYFYECDINNDGNLMVLTGKGMELSGCSRMLPGCSDSMRL